MHLGSFNFHTIHAGLKVNKLVYLSLLVKDITVNSPMIHPTKILHYTVPYVVKHSRGKLQQILWFFTQSQSLPVNYGIVDDQYKSTSMLII